MKKSLIAFDPIQLACFRIGIAGMAFAPFLIKEIKKVAKKDMHYFVIVALAGSGIPAYLYALAQTEVSSSVAGLLNSMTPLFTLIIGYLFFKTILSRNKICLLYTSPSPRDATLSRMPSSA